MVDKIINMENRIKSSAKKVMTTKGQKACYVIDHMVEALGNHSSSSLRRAIILVDIDQYPGTTQADIMDRVEVGKSALNREIDWLFNYGCIRRSECMNDGRAVKLEVYGYANTAVEAALDYFDGDHEGLKGFLEDMIVFLNQDKPSLRDAKIIAAIFEKNGASRQEIVDSLYNGSPSTESRAILKLMEEGVITGHDVDSR